MGRAILPGASAVPCILFRTSRTPGIQAPSVKRIIIGVISLFNNLEMLSHTGGLSISHRISLDKEVFQEIGMGPHDLSLSRRIGEDGRDRSPVRHIIRSIRKDQESESGLQWESRSLSQLRDRILKPLAAGFREPSLVPESAHLNSHDTGRHIRNLLVVLPNVSIDHDATVREDEADEGRSQEKQHELLAPLLLGLMLAMHGKA